MKIVFLDEYSLGGADLNSIKGLGEYHGYEITHTTEEILERAKDAQVVICNKTPLNRDTLAALPQLRLVCIAATGMNNVDLDAAAEFGIEVKNVAGYSTNSVAETTLGSALAMLRKVVYYDTYIKSGEYSKSDRLFNFDRPIESLHGKRWGIIGLGAIGRRVAQLATLFGCEVRYYSTSGVVRDEEWQSVATLDEILAYSDILSIHSPLNTQTANLIGAEQLRKMNRNAILINVARGGIVDEAALCSALDEGTIAGAALDVFANEPLEKESPLLRVNDPYKLLLSPHNAWAADRSIEQLVKCIAQNISESNNL